MASAETQLHKVAQELQLKYIQTQQELEVSKQQIASRQRELRIADTTVSELQQQNVTDVWKGIGKMFLKMPVAEHTAEISRDKKRVEESIEALGKKRHYLETTLKNTTDAIAELTRRTE